MLSNVSQLQKKAHTGHYSVTAAVVANSDLIAVMPERAVPPGLPLERLHLPIGIADALVRQFWHRRHDVDPGHRWLRETIGEMAF